jgi:hypothetical protein
MPSGGASPLPENEMNIVWEAYQQAVKHGLQYEWLCWFSGGIWKDKMSPSEAANAAAIEWDF